MELVSEEFEWMAQGNCRGKPTAMWLLVRGDAATARALCQQCPVKTECLEYALTDEPAPVGIWAGRRT
jgi:WhiB family transcriptional regulator, redox-sensing transcriptional regulator